MRVLRATAVSLLLLTAAVAGTDSLLQRYNRAYLLAGKGNPDEALPILTGILLEDPAWYRAYDLELYCYHMKNSPDLAFRFMEELRHKIGKPDPHLVYGIARTQFVQGSRKQSREWARQCIRTLPGWAGCYQLAADVGATEDPVVRGRVESFLQQPISDTERLPLFASGVRTREYRESSPAAQRESDRHFLELAVQEGDLQSELRLLSAAMTASLSRGDIEDGERSFQRLCSRALELGNTDELAGALVAKAIYHREQGDASEGAGLYRRALELYEQIGFTYAVANTLRQLAYCEIRTGDPSAAYHHLQRSVSEARAAHSPSVEAFAIDLMASVAATRGDYGEAIDFAARARRIFVQLDQLSTAEEVTGNLGIYFEKLGDWSHAEANYLAALRSADHFNDNGERERVLMLLASLAIRQGDLAKAAARLRESLASSTRSGDRRFTLQARIFLAEVLSRQRNVRQALDTLAPATEEAHALHDVALETAAWNAFGEAQLAGGHLDQAERSFKEAVTIARNANVSEALQAAYTGLGDVARRQGRLADSKASYSAAIGLVETVRGKLAAGAFRASFFGTATDVYDRMVDLLARENNARESWEYTEREKARVLLERISQSTPARQAQPQPLSRVQGIAARSGVVLVEYSVGESRSWVWAIDGRHISMAALPGRSVIESQVKRYRGLVAAQPDSVSVSQDLYRMLLTPIAPQLTGEKSVVIIPDGVLNYLPFESLNPAAGRYFAASFTVSYAPSAAVFAELQDRTAPKATRELLAYGDPDFGTSARVRADAVRAADEKNGLLLTPLPSTRHEVEDIAALYPSAAVKTYFGRAATKSSLAAEQLSSYRRLHFATHAYIDESHPERSGIALAVNGREDSILRVQEIANLRLGADLVVLSGCQTGLGKLIRGEGVASIGQAFLYAGAARVVVSLWRVNDTATAEFMKLFYQDMSAGRTPAAALRNAKIAMMNSPVPAYRHPRHWASFVLVGRP